MRSLFLFSRGMHMYSNLYPFLELFFSGRCRTRHCSSSLPRTPFRVWGKTSVFGLCLCYMCSSVFTYNCVVAPGTNNYLATLCRGGPTPCLFSKQLDTTRYIAEPLLAVREAAAFCPHTRHRHPQKKGERRPRLVFAFDLSFVKR